MCVCVCVNYLIEKEKCVIENGIRLEADIRMQPREKGKNRKRKKFQNFREDNGEWGDKGIFRVLWHAEINLKKKKKKNPLPFHLFLQFIIINFPFFFFNFPKTKLTTLCSTPILTYICLHIIFKHIYSILYIYYYKQ